MGQIPHKLAKVDNENPLDVTTPDEDFEENRDFHPNSGKKSKEVDYLNPSRNPNGRVVITPDPQRAQFYQLGNDPRIIDVSVETYGTVKVFMAKDIVTFMHPKFRDHEVICDNVEKVKINLFFYLFQSCLVCINLFDIFEKSAIFMVNIKIKEYCQLVGCSVQLDL